MGWLAVALLAAGGAPLLWYAVYQRRNSRALGHLVKQGGGLGQTSLGSPPNLPTVTVLVPARNEEANILRCLQALARVDYPPHLWQVLVLDDQSEDATAQRAQRWLATHRPGWQVVAPHPIQDGIGKKAALSHGANLATQAEWLVTLDADSHPQHPGWLRALVANRPPQVAVVVGPVGMAPWHGPWAAWQAVELAGLAALATTGVARGRPILANGANLAVRRAAFLHLGGYTGTQHRASGDDLHLLAKAHAAGLGLATAWAPQALVRTPPAPTWGTWWAQRLRWASKNAGLPGAHAKGETRLAWLAHLAWLGWVAAGWLALPWPEALALTMALVALKTALEWPLAANGLRLMNAQAALWALPLAQLPYALYVVAMGVAALTVRHYRWKGRRVQ